MDELFDSSVFSFDLPVFLVVSCRDKDPPEVFSLLNPAIQTPARRQHGFELFPIFTDDDLAQRFAEQARVFNAILREIKSADQLIDVLMQAKAIGRTHAVFDQTRESKRSEIHPLDNVIDALRNRQPSRRQRDIFESE